MRWNLLILEAYCISCRMYYNMRIKECVSLGGKYETSKEVYACFWSFFMYDYASDGRCSRRRYYSI